MAELSKEVVDQSLARIEQYSLGDDEVALSTSATLPTGVKVKGEEVTTAGTDVHGPVVNYTSKQVRQIAEQWGSKGRRSRAGNGRRRTAATDRRTTQGRRSAAARQGRTEAPAGPTAPESDRSADKTADTEARS